MNKPSKVKIAFFDVDNTLYDWRSHRFIPSTIEAIKTMKKRGVKVFIASARPYHSQKLFDMFDLGIQWDGYIASCGAVVKVGRKTLSADLMDHKITRAFVRLSKKHDLVGEVITPTSRYMWDKPNEYTDLYHDTFADVTPLIHPYYNGESTGILWNAPKEYDEEFKKAFPDLIFYRFHEYGVDVMPKPRDKGKGISLVLEHYGFTKDEAVAFGDELQDISMAEGCNHLVAVGNARQEVKEAAQHICDDIANDGIAKILKEFGAI